MNERRFLVAGATLAAVGVAALGLSIIRSDDNDAEAKADVASNTTLSETTESGVLTPESTPTTMAALETTAPPTTAVALETTAPPPPFEVPTVVADPAPADDAVALVTIPSEFCVVKVTWLVGGEATTIEAGPTAGSTAAGSSDATPPQCLGSPLEYRPNGALLDRVGVLAGTVTVEVKDGTSDEQAFDLILLPKGGCPGDLVLVLSGQQSPGAMALRPDIGCQPKLPADIAVERLVFSASLTYLNEVCLLFNGIDGFTVGSLSAGVYESEVCTQ